MISSWWPLNTVWINIVSEFFQIDKLGIALNGSSLKIEFQSVKKKKSVNYAEKAKSLNNRYRIFVLYPLANKTRSKKSKIKSRIWIWIWINNCNFFLNVRHNTCARVQFTLKIGATVFIFYRIVRTLSFSSFKDIATILIPMCRVHAYSMFIVYMCIRLPELNQRIHAEYWWIE